MLIETDDRALYRGQMVPRGQYVDLLEAAEVHELLLPWRDEPVYLLRRKLYRIRLRRERIIAVRPAPPLQEDVLEPLGPEKEESR